MVVSYSPGGGECSGNQLLAEITLHPRRLLLTRQRKYMSQYEANTFAQADKFVFNFAKLFHVIG